MMESTTPFVLLLFLVHAVCSAAGFTFASRAASSTVYISHVHRSRAPSLLSAPHVARSSSSDSDRADPPAFSAEDDEERAVVTMPIGEDVHSKDIVYSLEKSVLTLGVKGETPVIDNQPLWGRVHVDDCYWEIDDVNGLGRCVLVELAKDGYGKWEYLLKSQFVPPDTTVTARTYMDIEIDGEDAGRVEFGLYGNQVPRTVYNFLSLCEGEGKGSEDKALAYEGSTFHRIIPGFMIQGGDFTKGDGTGGESIYGAKFEDEDFGIKHNKPWLLSMANAGPDSNGSQFFITVSETPWLDGKHVVFGEVTEGIDVVKAIEVVGDETGTPAKTVRIKACGVLE